MFKPTAAADFADELFLLDFSDDKSSTNPNPNPSRCLPARFFQEILDTDVDGLHGLEAQDGRNEEEEEEELEWLANKDAFPALETSFDLSAQSFSSSSAASADRRSPVSVLASALPFRAPAKSRSKGQRRRRKTVPFFVSPPAAAEEPVLTPVEAAGKRKCRHCESEETPQWRTGPEGPKTLCNACGVRFKSGRLVPEYRPANSPTFTAAVHSNSHRRIVEMRRQKYGAAATATAVAGGHGRGRRSLVAGLAVM